MRATEKRQGGEKIWTKLESCMKLNKGKRSCNPENVLKSAKVIFQKTPNKIFKIIYKKYYKILYKKYYKIFFSPRPHFLMSNITEHPKKNSIKFLMYQGKKMFSNREVP